jgi:hypothetical protein
MIDREVFARKEAEALRADVLAGAAALRAAEPRLSQRRCEELALAVVEAVSQLHSEPLDPEPRQQTLKLG